MTVVKEVVWQQSAEAQFRASAGSVPPVALNWPSGGGGRGLCPREGGIPI
jgi:hypothetical protein